MRGSTLFTGLALAMGFLLMSTASAAVDVQDPASDIEQQILTTQDAFDMLVPGPVRDAQTSALATTLPGDDTALDPDPTLMAQLPAVPSLTTDVATPLDTQAPAPSTGSSGYQAPATAYGTIAPADASSSGSSQLPDYADGTASSPTQEDDGGASAATQSTGHSSADTSSSLTDAWRNMDDTEKAAVAAGALGLLVFGPLTLYSRIKRDDALENDTRREIYEIVETNPGVCIQDVADGADVSYSTASYHLKRLVRMDYVTRREDGNKVLYYKNGGTFTQTERELIPVVQNDEAMRVFRHIVENPWCYRAQVAEALDVSHTTVNWHLDRLQDADLVDEHREGRSCHLHVDEDSLDRVASVLDKLDDVETTEQAAPKAKAAAA